MIQPIIPFFKKEWYVWLALSILSFVGASLLLSGYPQGFLPELSIPFIYSGDGMGYMWNVQRAIEGSWYFENSRAGFPFGSNHLDYPTSDTGTYLILKILGWFFHSAVAVTNLYYLLGFTFCSVSAYLVARTLGTSKLFSCATALLYSFSSFHFWRIGHLYFTWYFVAPLFFYIGIRLFTNHLVFTNISVTVKTKVLNALCVIALSSFGIYYAFFGCIVLTICTITASIYRQSMRVLLEGCLTLGIVISGVLLNVSPSLYYIFTHGENSEGVNRLAAESELYALKITQLLLPRADHRNDAFFEFTSRYNGSFPLVTENISSSLGLIGSLGFLILMTVLLFHIAMNLKSSVNLDRSQNNSLLIRLRILAVLALGMVLLGTVGGGSSLFALTISTSIRSWNRISIFISFISIMAFMLCVNSLISKYVRPLYLLFVSGLFALTILAAGLYDQTVRPCYTCLKSNAVLAKNDSSFVASLEVALPSKAAIYQLPYMAYPEYGSVNNLGSYDQARGLLNSTQLRWSFGGMRGREGDWFYRKLALLPMQQQITILKAIGFSGIYVDRRGYLGNSKDSRCALFENKLSRAANNCMTAIEIETDIADAIGPNLSQQRMVSKDAQLSFTPLISLNDQKIKDTASNEFDLSLADSFLKPIGFKLLNRIPVQIEGGFELPLDLRKSNTDFPHYVNSVTGLSGFTVVNGVNEGRYSDALEAKRVNIWFSKPLPKKFTLQVRAEAAGPNAGMPLKVRTGKQVKELVFSDTFSTQTTSFETTKPIYKIEFIPSEPFSPARRWGASDTRFLAINFQLITITPD